MGVAVAIAVAVLLVRPEVDSQTKYVHDAPPVFNLLYDNRALHRVAPRAGELVRLEGRRGRLAAAIAVERLRLPAATGDVAHGLLPAYASEHVEALRAELPAFRLVNEGRARVNGAPGYEVRFRSGRTFGNDLMILPSEDATDDALLVTARRTVSGRRKLGTREKAFDKRVAKAYRSFTYGTTAAE